MSKKTYTGICHLAILTRPVKRVLNGTKYLNDMGLEIEIKPNMFVDTDIEVVRNRLHLQVDTLVDMLRGSK
ncbi:hypothetical protein [Methylobacter sp.]|uniref:hypothetical protein n=1 Tax=Methylobacter sp. TaxID=2051955 RepID=UPI00120BC7A7|nr:hypothetical protein [Methylobacter sp.]TAK59527.1 MAG: hypothetical protein EPO18_20410 [Methylobacter sp.]